MGDFERGFITFTSRTRVPEGAVPLTREEALRYQWTLIQKWSPRSDVLPLTVGPGVSSAAAGAGGAFFVRLFRKHYRLGNFGRLSIYLPCVILPALGAFLSQSLVSSDVVLLDTRCVPCLQLRANALQVFFGFAYPALMVPAACICVALRCNTYALPPLRTHYGRVISDVLSALRGRGSPLTAVLGLQCAASFLLLHFQMNSILKVQAKLSETQ